MRITKIRVVQNQPPRWFSIVANRYLRAASNRANCRPRPNFIKRADTLRALLELSAGRCETLYAKRWAKVIQSEPELFESEI